MAILEQIESLISAALPGATVEVQPGSPGHFAIAVHSSEFAGKSRVAQQRLVLKAISPLMDGDSAPVHAVDKLTLTH